MARLFDMAGLAALLTFGSDRTTNQTLEALSEALAARGADAAVVEFGAARLLIRAALPKVHQSDGAVLIVDGIAETSTLLARYSTLGPTGLLHGQHPYALILADIDGLMLARNLDGPPLYYARSRGSVLVASEPAALLAAGIKPVPNEEIVSRYLATGACDEVPTTFFEGIRRVLPGQVVEIDQHSDGWSIRAHPCAVTRPARLSARMALLNALGEERTGVVVDSGLPTAALLGAAVAEQNPHRAVPVYSASFPDLATNTPSFSSALLSPVPDGALKHRALPFFADEIDVDTFLADLGEPVPGLAEYLLWALARSTGGEVDVLLSAAGWRGASGHLSRLADRIAARYGVALRFPYRELDGSDEATRAELLSLAERTLPHASVRAANLAGSGPEPPLAAILERLRAEVAESLLYPRHGDPDAALLALLGRPASAKRQELQRVWRQYLVQRWLRAFVPGPAEVVAVPAAPPPKEGWHRHPIPTEPIISDLAEKVSWYVAEFVNAADKPTRQALRQRWLLLIAAKAVAVAQGGARPIWQVDPGAWAHGMIKLAQGRVRQDDPWSMQVAIERSGRLRLAAALLCARLGRPGWYLRLAGPVSPPREQACPPAHLSVVGPVRQPNRTAGEVVSELRRALPDEIFATLRGCAIVSEGRVMGWAGPQGAPRDMVERMCADDPLGSGDERTPLLIATPSPAGSRKPGRKPAKRR